MHAHHVEWWNVPKYCRTGTDRHQRAIAETTNLLALPKPVTHTFTRRTFESLLQHRQIRLHIVEIWHFETRANRSSVRSPTFSVSWFTRFVAKQKILATTYTPESIQLTRFCSIDTETHKLSVMSDTIRKVSNEFQLRNWKAVKYTECVWIRVGIDDKCDTDDSISQCVCIIVHIHANELWLTDIVDKLHTPTQFGCK